MIILELNWFFVMVLTTLIYWQAPHNMRDWWLVSISALFLLLLSWPSLLLLCGLSLLIYLLTRKGDRLNGKELTLIILGCGGLLAACKLRATLMPHPIIDVDPMTEKYIIPLGLSYYTFRCIHYGIEKYKGTIPAHPFSDFIKYIFYLPTFMAGPIHRFHDFQRDLRRKRWDFSLFSRGLERILFGYFKITFLNGLLIGVFMNLWVQDLSLPYPALLIYLNAVKNTLKLYLEFSGYADIAIGFGMLLGFKVMENFNFPFLAKNISEFWTRWHISLTSWCKDYVYMGTIAVTRSPILAAFAAMMVMGLWHEFSVRFIIWGLYHGAGIMLWQQFQKIKPHLPQTDNKAARAFWHGFCRFLTLHYFMGGVVIATGSFQESLEGVTYFVV